MKVCLIQRLILFFVVSLSANAAITITVAPDGLGGTTYSFVQTSPNPAVPVALASSSGVRMELPPEMFDPVILGVVGSSDILGFFDMIARFEDVGSGISYDVTGLVISNTLSSASFGFHRAFAQAPGQTTVQFESLSTAPGALEISPDALVEGTHSIGSLLFGTVTVNVIPEPSSFVLVFLGSLILTRRRSQ